MQRGDVIPAAREGLLQIKAAQACQLVDTLLAKPIHKIFYQQASVVEGTDMEGTFAWLTDGWFQAEAERLVIAAQEGVLHTNRYKHTVLQMSATSTYRVCREEDETIGHIVLACKPHT